MFNIVLWSPTSVFAISISFTERLGVGRFQTLALIATGLCFMADSMEISLLAFLTFTLKEEWNLSSTRKYLFLHIFSIEFIQISYCINRFFFHDLQMH